MKNIIFVAILAILSLISKAQVTGVLHYLPCLTKQQTESYAKYNVITVDPEVIFTSAESLRHLRELNPEIKILLYVNIMEWYVPMFPDKPWSIYILKELQKHESWWLHGTDGRRITFWNKTYAMNLRLDCPKIKIGGKRVSYVEYITGHVIKDVIGEFAKQGIKLNGVHVDQDPPKPFDWLGHYNGNQSGLDSNGDGIEDNPQTANIQWRLGYSYFMEQIRISQGKDFTILANGGNGFFLKAKSGRTLCNGKQFEDFPDKYLDENDTQTGGWLVNMNNASNLDVVMFNSRADNWLFTISSAMLLDNVIFAYVQNKPYDEKFDLKLGSAKGKFSQNEQEFSRQYENGTVYVNPYAKTARIKYTNGKILTE